MSYNFGEKIPVSSWGRGIQLSADGFPKAKAGGVHMDWSTVSALADDTFTPDQLDENGDPQVGAIPYRVGDKVVRYGTPIQRRASDGHFVLALTGGPKLKGDIYLVNETVCLRAGASHPDREPIAIDGGRVFKARLLYSGSDVLGKSFAAITNQDGSGSTDANIASGVTITLAELDLALPNISYALD